MKPIVIFVEKDQDGKVELTQQKLKEMLEDAYESGRLDGKNEALKGMQTLDMLGGKDGVAPGTPLPTPDPVGPDWLHKVVPTGTEPNPWRYDPSLTQTSTSGNPNVYAFNEVRTGDPITEPQYEVVCTTDPQGNIVATKRLKSGSTGSTNVVCNHACSATARAADAAGAVEAGKAERVSKEQLPPFKERAKRMIEWAETEPDCCGKWDMDATIFGISTRGWPDNSAKCAFVLCDDASIMESDYISGKNKEEVVQKCRQWYLDHLDEALGKI